MALCVGQGHESKAQLSVSLRIRKPVTMLHVTRVEEILCESKKPVGIFDIASDRYSSKVSILPCAVSVGAPLHQHMEHANSLLSSGSTRMLFELPEYWPSA